ncbi:chorismate-binding protein [Mycolicibacterium sp.]|uniref:chorismate-binding protein n=1 Tax=Mycolicibacterium sp. TaxID=2320850 RepID=UPI003D0C17E6
MMSGPAPGDNTAVAVRAVRKMLPGTISPIDVLARLRGRRRLVGLIGDWAGGGAVIACDPVRYASRLSDLTTPVVTGPAGVIGAGWIGVLGYQYGALLENLPPAPERPVAKPGCDFAYYDHLLRYDAAAQTWWFESAAAENRRGQVDRAYQRFARILGVSEGAGARPYECSAFTMRPGPDAHRRAVGEALAAIHAGEIFQTNLTARLQAEFRGDPLDLFLCGVEQLEPAYAAYLSSRTGAVASFSPELFLRREGRNVRTSPIKGTAPLHTSREVLLGSIKDNAENTMIVDLMRNDLGRVSVPGTVTVPHPIRVEAHTGVWHLVTDVASTLRDDVSDIDLLRATFPPGSVTGAPKVRAMELINELEATAREAYTGAIGVVSTSLLEVNVAIRTFEFAGGAVWFGVGGGIVADSTPDGELSELLTKAQPVLSAVGAELGGPIATLGRQPARGLPPRRGAGGGESCSTPPELAGRLPLFVVDDSGIRLDARAASWPALSSVVAALRRCHLRVDETALSADDLQSGNEAFVVGPDGTLVAVDVSSGRPVDDPGPLTRWLAARVWCHSPVRKQEHLHHASLRHPRVPAPAQHQRVLLVDNYDSFVFNLGQFCAELGARTVVVRSDPEHLADILAAVADGQFQRVIISPGPGRPDEAGISVPLIRALAGVVPILGVCLGHQAIGAAFGARTIRAPRPVHGQATVVLHDSSGIYAGLPGPFTAARYHSLLVDEASLPSCLKVTARTPSGLLMGVRHDTLAIEGIQVHPESLLTPAGHRILHAFLHTPATGVQREPAPPA